MKHVYLLRGIPGSGKSFLANILSKQGYYHIEADQYFMVRGEYKFEREKLKEAHNWCQHEFEMLASSGCNIVVSNTGIKRWEIEPYIEMAKKFEYKITEITIKSDDFESTHNVPKEIVERMKRDFEK